MSSWFGIAAVLNETVDPCRRSLAGERQERRKEKYLGIRRGRSGGQNAGSSLLNHSIFDFREVDAGVAMSKRLMLY
jgi:hypothetical protein